MLVHEAVRVEEAYPRKLELLSLYASQFKVPAIARDVDESSQAGVGSSERCEHFYRLEQRPARLSARQMTLEAPQVEEIVPRVRRWIERYREAPLIRILMVLPPGRWRDDLQRLSAAFPKTRFEVHAAPSSTAEAGAVASPVVEVRHVPAGAMGWIRTALRLALSRPAPTLFLCGDRAREARLLARLWPFSDTEQVCDTSGVDGQPAGPNGKVRGVR